MHDPGLDLHEWETRWSELDEQLHDDPAAALPGAADLLEELLDARGLSAGALNASELDDAELLRTFRSVREVADAVEAGEDVDPGDLGQAIRDLRGVYSTVSVERPA